MAGTQSPDVQREQASWLKDWQSYLTSRYANDCRSALEVGCGAGFVMENLSGSFDIEGVDIDPAQVRLARERGLKVAEGDGMALPFEDGSFDLVLCSFYLMWVKDIDRALLEMLRVSRKAVLILSEPVWRKAFYAPDSLGPLVEGWRGVVRREGGDPDAGMRVAGLVGRRGGRFGTVPADMNREEMEKNILFEYSRLGAQGIKIASQRPDFFHVPFIWGFLKKGDS